VPQRADPIAVYFATVASSAFIRPLIFTPLAVYYVTTVGLDPLQLVLVGTAVEGTMMLFEIPTGIVADVFSRRLSIVIGYVLFGAAYIFQGLVPLFAAIILAEVIRGIGETFLSGASQAWIADEVGENRVGPLFLRAAQIGRAAALLGLGAGVALASIQLNVAVVAGGVLSIVLAVGLTLFMPETGFRRAEHATRDPLGSMARIVRSSVQHVRGSPLLLIFLGIAAAAGASSEGFDRLWEAHLLTSFTFPALADLQPVVWIGLINAVGMLLGIAVIQFVLRVDTTDDRQVARVLLATQSVWLGSVVVFGVTTSFAVAVLALWSKRVADSMSRPLFEAWQARVIPSEVRATVLSAMGQGDALGQVLGGPVVGFVGSALSIRAAMLASSVLHVPVVALIVRLRRHAVPLAPAAPISAPPR
jgi:DHA3 family tetracycline resistance protein-like MFS transporter